MSPSNPFLHSSFTNSIEAGLTASYIGKLESQIALLDKALASLWIWHTDLVQSHWSAVALATPALWSKIFLDLDCVEGQDMVHLINTYLQGSAKLPLTIKITQGYASKPSHYLILVVALSSSEQWETVDLYTLPLLIQQITFLVDLNTNEDKDFEGLDESFWNIFSVTPQLRSLQALTWVDDFLCTPLLWHQFTRLSTTFTSNTEALAILQQLSDIVECPFTFLETKILLHCKSESNEDEPMDTHQRHTSLLDLLEMPGLCQLTTHKTADKRVVLDLITHSNCALASLHFCADSIDHGMMLHLVQKLTYLTLLVIGNFAKTLLPRSLVLMFIEVFVKQWIGAGREAILNHPRQIKVQIADELLYLQAVGNITCMLHAMRNNGLFLLVVPSPTMPHIIFEPFDY
ncbi:hypothetical protein DFH08DRAFT_819246 [Mycena albidolilacea]|uniref:Uncharacterized protein n=1 Tax=Mycena albidolilacea TaxID=1033008 RepID=A0AAD7EFQ2_9AGAR|nr:hypothetical protein DFH08DRAFT_819246 [Mycena albidolilacea]